MGLLADLQSAVAARLRASDLIAATPAVEIVEEDRGDIDAAIAKAVGKVGIVVSVALPAVRPAEGNRKFWEFEILLEIVENVGINRGPAGSQKTATALADNVIAMLLGWSPADNFRPFEFGGLDQVAPGTPTVWQFRLVTASVVEVIQTPDPE